MTQTDRSDIPLIDLSRWRDGNAHQREQLVTEVDTHLRDMGFLMVRNHGIDNALRDRARRAAKDFFGLPVEDKSRYACLTGAYRGWIAPGLESNAASYAANDGEAIVDLKEAFSVGPLFDGVEACEQSAPRWYAPNLWPDSHLPGFKQAMTDWWFAADSLTLEILEILAVALGFDDNWVNRYCNRPMATITANHYPEVDAAGGWRVGAHTDFGTVTILDRDTDNGLQVERVAGHWIDAPKLDDALTVNLGEMMVLLSQQRWRANPHRVVAKPGAAPNLSLVYFHDPNYDMPLPAQHADGSVVTAADFLGQKMDQITQTGDTVSKDDHATTA